MMPVQCSGGPNDGETLMVAEGLERLRVVLRHPAPFLDPDPPPAAVPIPLLIGEYVRTGRVDDRGREVWEFRR